MNWRQQCAVVIPCYNESATIRDIVVSVRAFVATVFVINDGSTDDTAQTARNAGAIVLSQSTRRGKGAALRLGMDAARKERFSYALCMDGDAQHAAADIPGFFACCERTGASLVIGNRFQSAGPMPWVRRVVNYAMTWILSWVAGARLLDTQCGFRLLRLSLLSAIQTQTEHFEFESEFLIEVIRSGERFEFIPIQTIYRSEQSKIRPLNDTARWIHWLARCVISRTDKSSYGVRNPSAGIAPAYGGRSHNPSENSRSGRIPFQLKPEFRRS